MITEETRQKMRQAKLGRKLPKSHKENISMALKSKPKSLKHVAKLSGANNHNWLGDDVGYMGVHLWLKKYYGTASQCEHCGAKGKKYNWANVSGKYLRKRDDFIELCVSCHRNYDMTPEQKRKFSQLSIGNTNQRKAVMRIDNNGNLKDYPSIWHAAQDVGVVSGAIVNCLKGLTKKSAGYKWQYKGANQC